MTEERLREEQISMAKEICSHRGENTLATDRGGVFAWEKYLPLARACIREAERLFALRQVEQETRAQVSDEMVERGAQAFADYQNRCTVYMDGSKPKATEHHKKYARIILEAALSHTEKDKT